MIDDGGDGISYHREAGCITREVRDETGLDPAVYDFRLTVRIDGADGELRAEDGRTVTKRNGVHLIDIRPGERVRLLLTAT